MTGITASVTDKIIGIEAPGVVAGNTYPIAVEFDSEWSGTAYLRVRFGAYHYDTPLTIANGEASATVQFPVGYPEVGIGIYSEALSISTNVARVRAMQCILAADTEPIEFDSALYSQWESEVTSLLVDDSFDESSDRPIANRVVAALDESALKKDLDSTLQTVQGPLVLDGTVKAQAAWVHAAYSGSVANGRYLKLFSFARPSGTVAITLGVRYRDSAKSTTIQVGGLNYTGGSPHGSIHVESNFADTDTYALTYDSDADAFEVYLHASRAGTRSLAVVVEGAVSTAAGTQIKVDGLSSSITNAASMTPGAETLAEVAAVDTGFNLTMGRTETTEAFPNWRPIWQAAVNATSGTSVCGVFVVSVGNPLGGYQYGICQLSQRTATTPALRLEWLCAAGISASDYAVVQQDGYVQLWAKKTSRYQEPVAVVLTGWRNYTSAGTIWAQPDSTAPVSDLPSGEGIYSAVSILNGTQGALAMMAAPSPQGADAPDAQPDEGEQR